MRPCRSRRVLSNRPTPPAPLPGVDLADFLAHPVDEPLPPALAETCRRVAACLEATGALLVREAGGFAREIDGGDFMQTGSIVATNERLLPFLTKVVKG